jgi:general secretion pathway protein G
LDERPAKLDELEEVAMKGQMKRSRQRGRGGFTLIELMVVIAILAMLAAIVGYNVIGSLEDAEITAAKQQITQFKSALISYRVKFSKFPSTEEGLNALISNEKGENLLDSKEVPPDPWGNPYVYTLDGSNFVIMSHGADGQPGGTGNNADISSDALDDRD